ncbi:MAG: RNA polymerase sigma factor [Acidimicrobiales bacterium]
MEFVERDEVDDRTIIEEYQRDPAVGFALLVDRESVALFGVLRGFCWSREDTIDAVAESFLRGYRALSSYTEDRLGCLVLRSWLFRIGVNIAKSRYRSDRARIERERRVAMLGQGQIEPSAEDSYWRDEMGEFEDLLARLPPPSQVVLVLRFVHGFTNAEIAETLSISEESVRTRAHRGIHRLRALRAVSGGGSDELPG